MSLHKDKIDEIKMEMSDENRRKALNCFQSARIILLENNAEGAAKILMIIIFFLFILVMFGPIVNASFIKEPICVLINLIGCIFYTFSISGFMGRCICCCLYRPCNWISLMIICDLGTIAINIIVIVRSSSFFDEYDNIEIVIIIAGFNCVYDLFLITTHFKNYMMLNDIYKRSREYEINVIKKCVMEYVKKL